MSGRDVRREEALAAPALGSAAGIGVRRMTSWVELVFFPGEPKDETFRAAEIILGHKALDIFIREGLAESMHFQQKCAGVDDFTRVGVEVARNARSVIGD